MQANIVVGLLMVALFAQAVLSLRLQRLRGRVEIAESKGRELARSVSSVRAWAVQEIEAMQDQAAQGQVTLREPMGGAPPGLTPPPVPAPTLAPPPDPEEQRTTLVTPAPKEVPQTLLQESGEAGDEEATTVFDPEALRHALRPPPQLGPDEETPHGERPTFVTMFPPPEKEGSS